MSRTTNTRDRVLQTTWKLLEDGGASSVRMADIAKAAQISRQALYLHFPNRAELLVATTRYLDEVHNVDTRLQESRTAETGTERLRAWIKAWGDYIPKIYGVAKALMVMEDDDAKQAWDNRMQAVRHGCAAAVDQLAKDGSLADGLSRKKATDLLWALLSVRVWEQLTQECGWSQKSYIDHMTKTAEATLVK